MSLPLCTSTLSSMSHSGVLNVFWSPCRFCLSSRDSWGNARGLGLGLPPEQWSPWVFWLCTSVWHLIEQRFLGPYKKSVNHWWDLKAFLDLIVFRAGVHGSSFLHTDISGRPRGHTWPRRSFLDSHPFSHASSSFHFSAFPPHCALLWSAFLFNLSIIQDAFFDPWVMKNPFPPPQNASSLLFIFQSCLLLE